MEQDQQARSREGGTPGPATPDSVHSRWRCGEHVLVYGSTERIGGCARVRESGGRRTVASPVCITACEVLNGARDSVPDVIWKHVGVTNRTFFVYGVLLAPPSWGELVEREVVHPRLQITGLVHELADRLGCDQEALSVLYRPVAGYAGTREVAEDLMENAGEFVSRDETLMWVLGREMVRTNSGQLENVMLRVIRGMTHENVMSWMPERPFMLEAPGWESRYQPPLPVSRQERTDAKERLVTVVFFLFVPFMVFALHFWFLRLR